MEGHSHLKCETTANEPEFWNALNIWNRRPNLLNKKILGAELIDLGFSDNITDFYILRNEVLSLHKCDLRKYFSEKKEIYGLKKKRCENHLRYHSFLKVIIYKCTNELNESLEYVIFDYENKITSFFKNTPGETSYDIIFIDGSIQLQFPIITADCENFVNWCSKILLSRLKQWAENSASHYSVPSLSLVSICEYKVTYNYLKQKYVSVTKKIWSEVTDPDKFIHEDVAIAAYLLLLWKDVPQTFVDLGCGNGLLVYILTNESHKGIGYDVRKRNIWDKYPSPIVLKAEPVHPSKELLFPETDWIIGNHSDELTPWIPVFATYSSYDCNFFLLPCCPHEFDGSKFKRINSSLSSYSDYLNFIEDMCKTFGFITERDKLRIPSTKRICIVSRGRKYPREEWDVYKKIVDDFISKRTGGDSSRKDWNINVKIRDAKEKVNNCTQLSERVKTEVLNELAHLLLQTENKYSQSAISQGSPSDWFEGVATPISKIAQLLPPQLLFNLKSESKGLQTFIKNHYHIFKLENGYVSFRRPVERKVEEKNWKKRDCWFFKNHINSCPLEDSKCSYVHKL